VAHSISESQHDNPLPSCWVWHFYAECLYAECHYSKCHFASVIMLSVTLLSAIMLSVIMLSVVVLSVAVPCHHTLPKTSGEVLQNC